MGDNEKSSISMHWRGWIKFKWLKKESINLFPVILVLYDGKYSFRKDGFRYLFIADLYDKWNRETFLWEAVPDRCFDWLLFIVLKWS